VCWLQIPDSETRWRIPLPLTFPRSPNSEAFRHGLLGKTVVIVSMGATVAETTGNSESSLRMVDAALYQAKRKGRKRVEQAAATPILSVG
jgi:GGDEF domain-containing protein